MPTTTSRARNAETRYSERILEQVLRLRAADALPMHEVPGAEGMHRWTFRAAGRRIQVDIDETVLGLRVYDGRQTISTGRVSAHAMAALLGRAPIETGGAVAAADCLAALREIVAAWREKNARVFMEPPRVARHPDGHNNA